jgi:fatty-acid desaturase
MVVQRDFLCSSPHSSYSWALPSPPLVYQKGNTGSVVYDMAVVRFWVRARAYTKTCCLSPINVASITIGYHRLYSHKAFRAAVSVRVALAILGSAAFQGSIKVRNLVYT